MSLSRRIIIWLWGVLGLITIALGLAIFGAYLAPLHFFFDLIAQFTWQLTGLVALSTLIFALGRRVRWAAFGISIILIGLYASNTRAPVPTCKADADTLKLVFMNMWVQNKTPDKTITFLENAGADIIVLTEISYMFRERFEPLKKAYPYHSEWLDGRHWMGVLSRHPFEDVTNQFTTENEPEQLELRRVTTPQGSFMLVGTHLTRPWPFNPPALQSNQAGAVAKVINHHQTDENVATVLVGDFNAVTWAGIVKTISDATHLKPLASRGTWHTQLPAPLHLPIDQALVSNNIQCATKRVAEAVGSDHNPIIVEFALKNP